MSFNPFVVIQEVAASVKDELPSIDLYCFHMMGRVPVDDVYSRLVD